MKRYVVTLVLIFGGWAACLSAMFCFTWAWMAIPNVIIVGVWVSCGVAMGLVFLAIMDAIQECWTRLPPPPNANRRGKCP